MVLVKNRAGWRKCHSNVMIDGRRVISEMVQLPGRHTRPHSGFVRSEMSPVTTIVHHRQSRIILDALVVQLEAHLAVGH